MATKEQPHNAKQCHLQMNGCIILDSCHVPCSPSCEEKVTHSSQQVNKYFELKKTRGALMGRPKLELLASNGVHICHAI